ncbi:MAG TPA: triose-phosphate isomerase [Candidatus Altiarchaeales archaeon]|nr:triose-phosphate isomerase [Candidatus Altiarchaeales archaeon]
MSVDLDKSIVVNFKTYEQATGENAVSLAMICDEVAQETGANIVVAVQPTDIKAVTDAVDIPVFAQHIDDAKYGNATGWILPEAVVDAGATGTLISHSEHKLNIEEIKARIARAKEVGLTTIVCAGKKEGLDATIEEVKAIAALKPDYIAAEPPELIGGDVSVTTQPDLITKVVEAVRQVDPKVGVLTGAGVKTSEHVAKAIELGTRGVLLASGVTKASDPKSVLLDLANGV